MKKRIPWIEEPGGLQSLEWQRIGLDCAHSAAIQWNVSQPYNMNFVPIHPTCMSLESLCLVKESSRTTSNYVVVFYKILIIG